MTTLPSENNSPTEGRSALDIPIEGLTCASCVARVENALKAVPGVVGVSVNLATERAAVAFFGDPDSDAVVRAVNAAGYGVRETTTELAIEGMTCASCVGRVEKALARVPGVLSASVNLATEKAQVCHLAGAVSAAGLEAAVRATGYEARLAAGAADATDEEAQHREREMRSLRLALIVAAVFTLPVVGLEMGAHRIPAVPGWIVQTIGERQSWYVQFALATAVLFGSGLRFFQKGVPALLRRAILLTASSLRRRSNSTRSAGCLWRPSRAQSITRVDSNPWDVGAS